MVFLQVPLFIPIFVMLASIFLVIVPFVMKPNVAYLYSIVFFFIGILFYIPFVHYDVKLACMGTLWQFSRLLGFMKFCAIYFNLIHSLTMAFFPDKVTVFFQILLESAPAILTSQKMKGNKWKIFLLWLISWLHFIM